MQYKLNEKNIFKLTIHFTSQFLIVMMMMIMMIMMMMMMMMMMMGVDESRMTKC